MEPVGLSEWTVRVGSFEPSDQRLSIFRPEKTMNRVMAIKADNDEIGGIIIAVVAVNVMQIYALFVARLATYLANAIGRFDDWKGVRAVFAVKAMNELAFIVLLIVLGAKKSRTLLERFWAHRTSASLLGCSANSSLPLALPFRACRTLGRVGLMPLSSATHARSVHQPVKLNYGVVMNAESFRGFREIAASFSYRFENWLAINLHPLWHGSPPSKARLWATTMSTYGRRSQALTA
jgi:hypothetical protein